MRKVRGVYLKNTQEIETMREAGRIVATILDALGEMVKPGTATMRFEETAWKMCREFGVKPGFYGYGGFPYALCCSVNEEVVHGFPSEERILAQGDIVSFDMGVIHKGFYGDSARTYGVGTVSGQTQDLMDATKKALFLGIEKAVAGNRLYDISRAVQTHAESLGYSVVRRFVGHGIGRKLHEKPEIPNFVPDESGGAVLKSGMVLAIEPMVCMGGYEVEILEDKWTVVTKDRKLSAHFEHTVAVTSDGPVILSTTSCGGGKTQ